VLVSTESPHPKVLVSTENNRVEQRYSPTLGNIAGVSQGKSTCSILSNNPRISFWSTCVSHQNTIYKNSLTFIPSPIIPVFKSDENMSMKDFKWLCDDSLLPEQALLDLDDVSQLRTMALEISQCSVVEYARIYREYSVRRGEDPDKGAKEKKTPIERLCSSAGGISEDAVFQLILTQPKQLSVLTKVCALQPEDHAGIAIWYKDKKTADSTPATP
jgi:hypothetical protein